ncbi:Roadblock/LC7 family protein [Chloroherpeton thalassium ATCC 35110]|uniref:Roadblock/LC7 family protein n=1 Tax=Chloroherpeton thalassium (strain ATCC 35110 / GB-78) TaxID=517418 RepID=B3QWP1_CHLT3|nr:roadblock/LC7 domain-containing protein [Chloroherpeton thalassium]ACF14801.1 Roadblock/LC7 family protein [Chloroherpeton thalassium ATCC 35110]
MSSTEKEDFRKIVLTENQLRAAEKVLKEFATKTGASAVILGDMTGQLLAKQGGLMDRDLEVFSVLAASNFAATAEMAKQIGERTSFEVLFHEGEARSIYLLSLNEKYILEVIFKSTIPPGTIRIYSKKAKEKLLEIISSEEFEVDFSNIFDDNFNALLDEQLNKTLGENPD